MRRGEPYDVYRRLVRPLLFRLEPETAHRLSAPILRSRALCQLLGGGPVVDPRLKVEADALRFPNPVGLAPGFDKHAEFVAGLGSLGFGYLVAGTVMPEPRAGNPRPRIVRIPEQGAMLNCLGLPSHGLEAFARRLASSPRSVPVIASLGAPDLEGYLRGQRRLRGLTDAVEINLQCANNADDPGANLRPDAAERIVAALAERKTGPLYLKLNSYETEAERQDRLELVERLLRYAVDGFSTPSTWRGRDPRLSLGEGNWSGRPLLPRTVQIVRDVYDATRGRVAIHARGGISSGRDAFEAIAAGATTVEVLTAFVYQGWSVARQINRELLALLRAEGVPSVTALRGARRLSTVAL